MMPETNSQPALDARTPETLDVPRLLRMALLGISAVMFALHFLHLNADFPNHSPWNDWSKYTDEGWYGDAAIRHYTSGHWYWPGDFNPAVALPAWPFLEAIFFRFTGVSAAAARTLTLLVFGATLVALYRLLERHTHAQSAKSGPSLAAPLAVFLLCCSPFFYVFERMAIIEPLLVCLTVLAMLAASHLHPVPVREALRTAWVKTAKALLPSVALGALIPAMVLAKTTAVCLVPAIAYMVWARAGYRLRPAIRMCVLPLLLAVGLWSAYFFLLVKPHYLADYKYLFSANAYTGIELDPLATVVLNTLSDGMWMGKVLFPCFFGTLALALFWRPRLLTNPLVPALVLWTTGYTAFLLYHNNLQPRYYLVVAAPITVLVAIGLDVFRQAETRRGRVVGGVVVAAVVLAIAVPDAVQQVGYVLRPTYDFIAAAREIKALVMADATHPKLVLSISGSDMTLMTGLPSICDDFGTLELDQRVKQYRPGWYVAWNNIEDDKMDALTPLYHLERIAAFPAMDDPDRNLLILYRLDPTLPTLPTHKHKPHTPKPLVTKLGQQPSTEQLEH